MTTTPTAERATCTICGHPENLPYRRIVGGKIVEGCVASIHDVHLISPSGSKDWATSAAKSIVVSLAERAKVGRQ